MFIQSLVALDVYIVVVIFVQGRHLAGWIITLYFFWLVTILHVQKLSVPIHVVDILPQRFRIDTAGLHRHLGLG